MFRTGCGTRNRWKANGNRADCKNPAARRSADRRKTRVPAAAARRRARARCRLHVCDRAPVRPTGWPAGRGGSIGGSSVVYSVARAHTAADTFAPHNRDIIIIVVVVLSPEILYYIILYHFCNDERRIRSTVRLERRHDASVPRDTAPPERVKHRISRKKYSKFFFQKHQVHPSPAWYDSWWHNNVVCCDTFDGCTYDIIIL